MLSKLSQIDLALLCRNVYNKLSNQYRVAAFKEPPYGGDVAPVV
jgi:hypothetical protein